MKARLETAVGDFSPVMSISFVPEREHSLCHLAGVTGGPDFNEKR
jgi:hypothetical protein